MLVSLALGLATPLFVDIRCDLLKIFERDKAVLELLTADEDAVVVFMYLHHVTYSLPLRLEIPEVVETPPAPRAVWLFSCLPP